MQKQPNIPAIILSKLTPDEFVRKTVDGVYSLALRLTGNASDAWDLTHDVLLKALQALPQFRGEADPRTWVYRITVNTWKNRAQSRAWRWWRRLLSLERAPETAPGPERAIERREEAAAVEEALEQLSPEDRTVVLLREYEGKSYEEIADITGVPIGTVKSRLNRARTILARLLERNDGT